MDDFDIGILKILKDGKPKEFKQILSMVKFINNTLRMHLKSLMIRTSY